PSPAPESGSASRGQWPEPELLSVRIPASACHPLMQDQLGEIPFLQVIHPQPRQAAVGNTEMLAAGEGRPQQVTQQQADGAAVEDQQQALAAITAEQAVPGTGQAVAGLTGRFTTRGSDGTGKAVIVFEGGAVFTPCRADLTAFPDAEMDFPQAGFKAERLMSVKGKALGKVRAALQRRTDYLLPAIVRCQGGGHLLPALGCEGRIRGATENLTPL